MFVIRVINSLYRRLILPVVAKNNIHKEQLREEEIVLKNFSNNHLQPLTEDEKKLVAALYGWGGRFSYNELGLFKKYRGFDNRYLSHFYYLPLIAHRLNNYKYTKFFEHKSLLGYLVPCGIKYANCYVRCIDAEYYNDSMNQISKEDAIRACLSKDILIVKDSVDSSGGQSVEKIVLANMTIDSKLYRINKIFNERKRDFVIQECIKQHPSFAKFNESSINTLRVTTLYLNGKYSTLSIILRFGKQGMKVDNWGSGGIIVGIDNNGKLQNFGYDIQLNKFEQYNGIYFRNEIIDQIPSLLSVLENAHKNCFSLCKFIGWDICYNENNEPIIIELNSSQPGVIGEQLCTGPIFGDRTQEVLDYCKNKEFRYNKSIFEY